jgi:hypothetical protein
MCPAATDEPDPSTYLVLNQTTSSRLFRCDREFINIWSVSVEQHLIAPDRFSRLLTIPQLETLRQVSHLTRSLQSGVLLWIPALLLAILICGDIFF